MVTHEQLVALDKEYFENDEEKEYTDEEAAYHLATWIFDHEGSEQLCRKKIKEQLPHLYLAVLEDFIDGNHDT